MSSIYRIKFSDILLLYGVDLQHLTKHQLSAPLPKTHLTTLEVYDTDKTVSFPVRFDRSFDVDNTNLLSRMVEVWGEVPIALIQHLDLRHSLYGYIGLQDNPLSPLLRPEVFRADLIRNVRKIQPFKWRTESDRPIYFVQNCATATLARAFAKCREGHSAAAGASAVGTQRAPPQLWHRSRNHWTGHRRGDAPHRSGGDWFRRDCQIAKASLTFDRNNRATAGFTSTGIAMRYGSSFCHMRRISAAPSRDDSK